MPDESAVEGPGDLLWAPRLAVSLDLTDTQTLLAGASAAFGPNNSGPDADTEIFGGDVYWKWRPVAAQRGFPFVSLQAEALWRAYEAGEREPFEGVGPTLPEERLEDRGFYAQLLWGIRPLVVAGIRGERVRGDEGAFASELRGNRWRVSPNLTWYPTEYSKLRVQYNYDDRAGTKDHSLWLQAESLLGAHAAHQF